MPSNRQNMYGKTIQQPFLNNFTKQKNEKVET